ncbi:MULTISPECIES: DAK2 domain-containing protein [unclassified Rhodococcus (in: high G+C Gram-positive bacteria)]|uniref:DAK2 domain-containing protein n=1 Tax=unclassified Rhodococcus (in: high G+C Gram-positive bacteria) TaxID=192944 RepID=UPI0016396CF4|nr:MULTISPECIES: DAK2 domain-containing protein [unclassified Rhodococcus (in: high G+C Gram-positive bacteria)]MBC2643707.1 DAK2 domain-containing protein [Rhodococcus sp. 3A]MBC2891552.1 DAK2 domain-containing protein [Rhodococcus sp. 4CII]
MDGRVLELWARTAVAGLEKRCEEINSLNVFPIPDADTGTNLLFTMRAALAAVDEYAGTDGGTKDVRQVAIALAKGAVAGARGNSGVILSQVLRGVAEAAVTPAVDTRTVRTGLLMATNLVTDAVSYLVEGTIVTVLRCAADAAAEFPDETPIANTARGAADAAAAALTRTPSQLEALGTAGVVDAGGLGLVVILDALVTAVTGAPPDRPPIALHVPRRTPSARRPEPVALAAPQAAHLHPGAGPDCDDGSAQDFEVMYLVSESDESRMADLRSALHDLGDSIVIVGDGGGGWSVHVHCTDAGAAVEAGLAAGRIHGIRVSSFLVDARDQGLLVPQVRTRPDQGERGIVAVVAGDGAAELFASEGATVLRCDDAPVTRAQLLGIIRQMGRTEVLVLPNGALTAQELVAVSASARDARHEVLLLATSAMVQGLASLAVHDPEREAVDDAFAMSEAAAATRWGSLRIARERALTYVGTCEPGDGIGLMGHEVIVIESDAVAAGRRLVDLVLGAGGELVTLLMGSEAPEGLDADLADHISQRHPGVEVMIYQGGQPGDLLQLGVE